MASLVSGWVRVFSSKLEDEERGRGGAFFERGSRPVWEEGEGSRWRLLLVTSVVRRGQEQAEAGGGGGSGSMLGRRLVR